MSKDEPDLPDRGEAFAQNMAKVAEISAQIWALMLESKASPAPTGGELAAPMLQFARTFWAKPEKASDSLAEYWGVQQALWQQAMAKWTGAASAPDAPAPSGGKRFAHPAWSENALFDYIKNTYLLTADWVQNQVSGADDLSEHERKKLALMSRNMVEAMNPANFFALNPEVLQATFDEQGGNLVRGLTMMLEDIERGQGNLLIRQTDLDAFKVGENMATTPGAVIYQNEVLQLIQYAPATKTTYAKPLLFVPPWINKYYVLDLNQKKSMMKWLVSKGYTVFIISWVNPNSAQKDQTWDSYLDAILAAIDVALAETGQKSLQLAGYCIGGTMTGTLLAQLGKADKRVASATFLTTLLDFTDAGELQAMVDEESIKQVDTMMEGGFLPAQYMASAFNSLRANDLIWSYVVNNYLLGKEPFPFDLLYWNSDSTAMPAKVHHFYLTRFYLRNAFAKGGLTIKGKPASLSDIRGPVYQLATVEDHIAPAASVLQGAVQLHNANTRFVLAGSGHIAGVVNPPAAKKYQYWAADDPKTDDLEGWRADIEPVAGSWWFDWDKWLKKRAGKRVPARDPGAVNGVIEPAPGAYVKKRFDLG